MAKFCSKCGKPLVEGVPCECEKENLENNSKEKNIDIKNEIINIFKNMFTKPFDTIKQSIKVKNYKLALILIIINALVFGLVCYFTSDTVMINIAKTINEYFTAPMSFVTGNNYSINIETPFLKIVIGMGLASFISNIIMVLAEYLCIGVVFKHKKDIKEFLIIHANISVIDTILTIIVSISIFVSIKLAICLVIFKLIMYICMIM